MNILIKPVITEKMTEESEKFNRFGFIVDRRANKLEIKDAVEKMYGVSVDKVRTMVYPGKAKTRNTKGGVISGRTNSYKKAIVDLDSQTLRSLSQDENFIFSDIDTGDKLESIKITTLETQGSLQLNNVDVTLVGLHEKCL